MFIEVTVDGAGAIVHYWCADTAPVDLKKPLYSKADGSLGDPPGTQRVRLDITAVEWLEIEARAKDIASSVASQFLATGQADLASLTLRDWKQHRGTVLQRDVVVDLAAVPVAAADNLSAAGIPYVKPTIKAKPLAPVVVDVG